MEIMDGAFWEQLQNKSKCIESGINNLLRKRTGSYYTHLALTDVMMKDLVSELLKDNTPIEEKRFLEPCVGVGNFVFSYLKELHNIGLSRERAAIAINNIYVADINEFAIQGYMQSLKELADRFWNIELNENYFDKHIGSGLLLDVTATELKYVDIADVFSRDVLSQGFDIIATNPPYKNLKAESGHYASEIEYNEDKVKYTAISKLVKNRFKYAVDGTLNLYKLFVEEIIDTYSNANAYVSLLIPASILSDKTCLKLRTHILTDMDLKSVKVIREGSGYVDAQQALAAILIHKGENTKSVSVTKDFCNMPQDVVCVNFRDIENPFTGNAIFAVSNDEYEKLQILRKHPVVKELDFICNLRGELDLTSNKKFITQNKTSFKLIRGKGLKYYSISADLVQEYVDDEFVTITSKRCYIEEDRIACQQIANMHKERRITFALVPRNNILANSCNFIYVSDNKYGIDTYAILGLFNTRLINWLFKLTSSNNHVNNYEIDSFPIPVASKHLKEISELVKKYLSSKEPNLIDEIEYLSELAYGLVQEDSKTINGNNAITEAYLTDVSKIVPSLTYAEADSILNDETVQPKLGQVTNKFTAEVLGGITEKYRRMLKGCILNHKTFKLSDLDLEMIKSVPPGGNWKNIPMETVEKSKRLKRITQTGGRTTLYGRIMYEKPSYTITTYFNRPGNGTYVHPSKERVLSVREAARFQTFRDDYYFWGNKSQLLKQVGNAVPTILAYQIGKEIKEKTGCSKSVDLFCGAGGMTVGFKAAGIQSLLSNDIEESACITLKINNPEIPVLCGDITQSDIKDLIENIARNGNADIICGGPPCQGFSMAGFRSADDPRNQLFREFVDIVNRVNPKVIVFENVEGLLSYQGGRTYREVHKLFSELGYETEGRTLMASDYAVPQKRKRVIIICTRRDLNIQPSELFPTPITCNEESQVTARETIYDLDAVDCDDDAKYTDEYTSDIIRFFKKQLSYDEYVLGRTRVV